MRWGLSARDYGLLAAGVALLFDQATKLFMLYGLGFRSEPYESHVIPVLPFFNIIMVWNKGVSYGWLSWLSPAFLVLFAVLVVGGLGVWLWLSQSRALALGLGLIMGGALGNLLDRMVYGRVADFFHFYVRGFDWYVFNVADVEITLGVIAMLYDALHKPEAKAVGSGD
ncbi:MAG: signal peptidase II [Alphaproteobacteria bacterium]|nr:signal peptidase II [Alphaproteobacteria bacterium]MBV9695023.1 signal peptidase II [Alphaproteobacteria bacterium]